MLESLELLTIRFEIVWWFDDGFQKEMRKLISMLDSGLDC
jgi:hypothetical protein